nr:hypothetical protein [Nonomuraea fuscirosea]
MRTGTAATEALLRRFTGQTTHPAYAAMLEVGRAQRTISWLAGSAIAIFNTRPSPG